MLRCAPSRTPVPKPLAVLESSLVKGNTTLPRDFPVAPIVKTVGLKVVGGPDEGRHAIAKSDRLSVGSAEGNDLVMSDRQVSRYHLDLVAHDGGIRVQDNDSTNGTFAKGVRIERAIVRPGTKLQIGDSVLQVLDGDNIEPDLCNESEVHGVLGRTPSMRRLMELLKRTATSQVPILLNGESGTGKEKLAEAVHSLSSRSDGPFVAVDCGALVSTLLQSELFGHERGAFTGADEQRIGAFERAHGGTLFLDEIAELPLDSQVALLGVLERRHFRRLGGNEQINVDFRVVCATHRNVKKEVNNGSFRQDLYYRLAGITLHVPPLRDRRDDIPLLIEHFLRQEDSEQDMASLMSSADITTVRTHHWPGNVRELRNFVQVMLALGRPPELEGEQTLAKQHASKLTYSQARASALRTFERAYLSELLAECKGNVTEVSRRAKLARSRLYQLLHLHNLR